MNGLIDFHTHCLPCVDDGSTSVKMSLEMLRMEAEQGVKKVVATPHFYAHHDTPEHFLERRERAEQQLREAMAAYTGLPELHVGAEVAFFRGMSESEVLQNLRIDDTQYILIEMPAAPWQEIVYQEVQQIYHKQGLTPVIAHVERYLPLFQSNHVMEQLMGLPVLIQANASFLLRRSTSKTAFRFLREGKIHLLGSDCHNLESRAPNLGQAFDRMKMRFSDEIIGKIVETGRKIL